MVMTDMVCVDFSGQERIFGLWTWEVKRLLLW